jgi:hypothetical protein
LPRWLALVGIVSQLVACGYGPPERYASITDYDTAPNGQVTAALRSFDVTRPARGLNAFPDGGFAKGLDQGVEVNICDKTSGTFRQIAVLHEREEQNPRFSSPRIVEWLDTAIRITRYTGGDTVVRLPNALHVGNERKAWSDRVVVPECEASLNTLRRSDRMPDGKPTTPLASSERPELRSLRLAMPLTHRSYPKRTAYDVRALMEASPTHWPR